PAESPGQRPPRRSRRSGGVHGGAAAADDRCPTRRSARGGGAPDGSRPLRDRARRAGVARRIRRVVERMSGGRSASWLRTIAINLAALITLLLAIEIGARTFVWLSRGTATAGLRERTLNLEYEPFVMYRPGWDARRAAVPRDDPPTGVPRGGTTAEGCG